LLLYGSVSILAGFLLVSLPETKGKDMPDTTSEVVEEVKKKIITTRL
jgi:hypothetical protein